MKNAEEKAKVLVLREEVTTESKRQASQLMMEAKQQAQRYCETGQ